MVQVHYGEGVAIHTGPEPCAAVREGGSEASAGECIGQPLSRESARVSRASTSLIRRKATRRGASARAPRTGPAWSKTLACAVRSLYGNREISWFDQDSMPSLPVRIGRGEEPKPMMHGREKSDPAIVADEADEQSRATGGGVGGAKGRKPRGMRASKARAGLRTGKACPRRWAAYGKQQG